MGGYPAVGDTFGPYRIASRLGSGGMGIVFEAVQERLNQRVALKVMDPRYAADPAFVARFLREARLLASMESPHIVRIYDAGETDGALYLAMQYVGGGDLAALIAEGPLPTAQALDFARQVTLALADAHESGVIHRDVKPSNVLLASSGRSPFCYLCDFGIATSDDGNQTSVVAGSPAFMAPERHHGEPATARTDLYAVGCLLWAMMTGSNPYVGATVQVAMAHAYAELPTVPGAGRLVAQLNRIIGRTMAKDPAGRYASAQELLADLDAALALAAADEPGPGWASAPDDAEQTYLGSATVALPAGEVAVAPRPAAATAAARPRRGRRAGVLIGAGLLALLALGVALWSPFGSGLAVLAGVSPKPPAYQCWDDKLVDSVAQCTTPVGEVGLRYLFPALAEHEAVCGYVTRKTATLTLECPLADGLLLRFRYWADAEKARSHYEEVYAGPSATLTVDGRDAGRLFRRDTLYQGVYRISGLLSGDHISFSVEAPTTRARDAAFAAMRIRSFAEFTGHRVGATPGVTGVG